MKLPLALLLTFWGALAFGSTPPYDHSKTIEKELKEAKLPWIEFKEMDFRRVLNFMEVLIFREEIRAAETDIEFREGMYPSNGKPVRLVFEKEEKPKTLSFRIEKPSLFDALQEIAKRTGTEVTIDFESVRFTPKSKSEPDAVVNASAAAGISENHLHD